MNYIGLNFCDAANGPGMRVSLFVSGCTLHCHGCFNPESWDFDAGKPFTDDVQKKIINAMKDPFIRGLSLLGGDPLEPEHEERLVELLKAVRAEFGDTKDVWVWTGRRHEKVADREIMKWIDVLIDGPFVEKLKIHEPGWFGSSNQRIIPIRPGAKTE